MAIYAGIDGVSREIKQFETSRWSENRIAYSWKAGINGVVRPLNDIAENIDYVEINPRRIETYKIDSDGDRTDDATLGYSLETANKYGKVDIDDDSICVYSYNNGVEILLESDFYIVFKDGTRVELRDIAKETELFSFNLKVYTKMWITNSSSNKGFYRTWCLGTQLYSAYYTDSASVSTNITEIKDNKNYSLISAAKKSGSGRTYTLQRFDKFTINGKSYSIKIRSTLTEKEDE